MTACSLGQALMGYSDQSDAELEELENAELILEWERVPHVLFRRSEKIMLKLPNNNKNRRQQGEVYCQTGTARDPHRGRIPATVNQVSDAGTKFWHGRATA